MFRLQTDKGVGEQPVFWLSIAIPVVLAFITGWIALQGKSLSLSADGFKEFLSISTLPLIFLGTSVPLSTLVWRLHATRQTAEQIIVTRLKNNVDAFYAHRKALVDYFSYVDEVMYEGEVKGVFKAHPRLHLKFFVNQTPDKGMPFYDEAAFKGAIELLSAARTALAVIISEKNAVKKIQAYSRASEVLTELGTLLVLKELYERLPAEGREYQLPGDSGTVFRSLGLEVEQLIGAYRYSRSVMRLLCEFAGYKLDYFTAEVSERLHEIDKGTAYERALTIDEWARDYRHVPLGNYV